MKVRKETVKQRARREKAAYELYRELLILTWPSRLLVETPLQKWARRNRVTLDCLMRQVR